MQVYTELKKIAVKEGVEEKEDSEEWQVTTEEARLLIPEAEKLIPKGYKVALRNPGWKKAIQKEFDALIRNHTWDLVQLPENRKAFPNKWVFSIKSGAKLQEGMENNYKVRLVARGDLQKPGVDFKETFAPVVKFVTFRILMTYVAINDLECDH